MTRRPAAEFLLQKPFDPSEAVRKLQFAKEKDSRSSNFTSAKKHGNPRRRTRKTRKNLTMFPQIFTFFHLSHEKGKLSKGEKRFSAVKHGLEIIGQQREMIDLMCAIKCEFIAKKEDVWCVQALHSIDFYDVRKSRESSKTCSSAVSCDFLCV
jgi:hypothetical protein